MPGVLGLCRSPRVVGALRGVGGSAARPRPLTCSAGLSGLLGGG